MENQRFMTLIRRSLIVAVGHAHGGDRPAARWAHQCPASRPRHPTSLVPDFRAWIVVFSCIIAPSGFKKESGVNGRTRLQPRLDRGGGSS